MRFLFYTDLHAADQNPRSRTGSYYEDILTKLKEIIDLALEYKVDYLINGADTFDRKSASRVSHKLVAEMIDIMRPFPGNRHLTVIGTHDVPTGQLHKLPRQPLGVLQEAGVITVLEPQKLKGGVARYPEPVLSEKAKKDPLYRTYVNFHPVPASYDLDKDPANYVLGLPDEITYVGPSLDPYGEDATTGRMEPDDFSITIAHGMVVPRGGSFFGDYTDAHQITQLETRADVFVYGHPHTPDGVFYTDPEGLEYSKPLFIAPGSISRRDKAPYNQARRPQVCLFESPSLIGGRPNTKMIELQTARDPKEVFADAIKEEEDENLRDERVEAFVASLKEAEVAEEGWGVEQLLQEIRAQDSPDEIRELAEQILEAVAS